MLLALVSIVHLAWIDVWLRPHSALLLDRRAELRVGSQAACRGRALTGTVVALAGQRFEAEPGASIVALKPDEIAISARSKPSVVAAEPQCRLILAEIPLGSAHRPEHTDHLRPRP
jgi:hypothetical protein